MLTVVQHCPVDAGLEAVLQLDFEDLGFQHDLALDGERGGLEEAFDVAHGLRRGLHHDHAGLRIDDDRAAIASDGAECGFQFTPEVGGESRGDLAGFQRLLRGTAAARAAGAAGPPASGVDGA